MLLVICLPCTPFWLRQLANLLGRILQILSKIAGLVIDSVLRDCIVKFRKPCNINWARYLAFSNAAPAWQKSDQNQFLSGLNSIIESHKEFISATYQCPIKKPSGSQGGQLIFSCFAYSVQYLRYRAQRLVPWSNANSRIF